MKLACTITKLADGRWLVRHADANLGPVEVSAAQRDDAVRKMRDELQYRFELCPCSGVSGDTVELIVRDE